RSAFRGHLDFPTAFAARLRGACCKYEHYVVYLNDYSALVGQHVEQTYVLSGRSCEKSLLQKQRNLTTMGEWGRQELDKGRKGAIFKKHLSLNMQQKCPSATIKGIFLHLEKSR